ncbi:MAG TPA: response regulator [Chloroflexota bacterium]|nr:response regulator [Chloroflexota bacterium]
MAKKVLIVEDEPDIQEVERMVVQDMMGCDVTIASSGEEALTRAQENSPDLVMLDLVLPGMDGFTVASHLRQEPRLEKTPILALSGLTRAEDKAKAKEVGCNDVLDKPFDLDDLMNKVEQLVGSCRTND